MGSTECRGVGTVNQNEYLKLKASSPKGAATNLTSSALRKLIGSGKKEVRKNCARTRNNESEHCPIAIKSGESRVKTAPQATSAVP